MSSPFRADALAANRGGALTDEQRAVLRAFAGRNRGVEFVLAIIVALGGVALVQDAGRFAPAASWHPIAGVMAIGVAVMIALHALGVGNALDRDIREGRVQSIEGAIRKRRGLPTRGNQARTDFLIVNDQRFMVGPAGFGAAPDAAFVRLFYAPHSRRVVNLEELPARAEAAELLQEPERGLRSAATAIASGNMTKIAELRADAAAAQAAWQADQARAVTDSSAAAAQAGTARPLAQAIVGRWTMGGLVSAEFQPSGVVIVERPILGAMRGHWTVDDHGRLRADVTGREQTVEATVAGDVLTIALEGTTVALRRQS